MSREAKALTTKADFNSSFITWDIDWRKSIKLDDLAAKAQLPSIMDSGQKRYYVFDLYPILLFSYESNLQEIQDIKTLIHKLPHSGQTEISCLFSGCLQSVS